MSHVTLCDSIPVGLGFFMYGLPRFGGIQNFLSRIRTCTKNIGYRVRRFACTFYLPTVIYNFMGTFYCIVDFEKNIPLGEVFKVIGLYLHC
jgi:hypothetical protein